MSSGDRLRFGLRLRSSRRRGDLDLLLLRSRGILIKLPRQHRCLHGTVRLFSSCRSSVMAALGRGARQCQFHARPKNRPRTILFGVFTLNLAVPERCRPRPRPRRTPPSLAPAWTALGRRRGCPITTPSPRRSDVRVAWTAPASAGVGGCLLLRRQRAAKPPAWPSKPSWTTGPSTRPPTN